MDVTTCCVPPVTPKPAASTRGPQPGSAPGRGFESALAKAQAPSEPGTDEAAEQDEISGVDKAVEGLPSADSKPVQEESIGDGEPQLAARDAVEVPLAPMVMEPKVLTSVDAPTPPPTVPPAADGSTADAPGMPAVVSAAAVDGTEAQVKPIQAPQRRALDLVLPSSAGNTPPPHSARAEDGAAGREDAEKMTEGGLLREPARSEAVPAERGIRHSVAARAYRQAGKMDASLTDSFAEEALEHLPRAPEVRAASPTPAGVPGEARPEGAAPALSARAAAVLRALGFDKQDSLDTDAGQRTSGSQDDNALAEQLMAVAGATANGDRQADQRDAWQGRRHEARVEVPSGVRPEGSHWLSSDAPRAEPLPANAPAWVPPAPAGATLDEPPLSGQIVKAVSLAWREGVGEARIRLTPEHLGEVVVSMKVERGQVVAEVAAETPMARAWIESHQEELRQNLSQQGLQLDRLVVTADGERQQRPREDTASQSRRNAARRFPGREAPRFEVSV